MSGPNEWLTPGSDDPKGWILIDETLLIPIDCFWIQGGYHIARGTVSGPHPGIEEHEALYALLGADCSVYVRGWEKRFWMPELNSVDTFQVTVSHQVPGKWEVGANRAGRQRSSD